MHILLNKKIRKFTKNELQKIKYIVVHVTRLFRDRHDINDLKFICNLKAP